MSKTSKTEKPSSKGAPLTMDDLLSKFGGDAKPLIKNEVITGTVIRLTPHEVYVDIGRKTEGLIAEKAFKEARDYIENLKVGDKIETFVIVPETSEGYTILSLRHTIQSGSWDKLQKHLDSDTPLTVTGRNTTGAGLMVDVYGMTGFIPNSLLGRDGSNDPSKLVNESFEVKIIEIIRSENKIILSRQAVSDAGELKISADALSKVKVDDVYEGTVTKVTDFGLFVKISVEVAKGEEVALEGLVHISELSWGKTQDIKEAYKVGDKVEVIVIGKEASVKGSKAKLSLSVKKATADPWNKAIENYPKDSKHKGTVTKVSDYGAFVSLEDGVEGLIHVTKIPPNTKLTEGESVNVYVEEIDPVKRKLSLGIVLTSKPLGYK